MKKLVKKRVLALVLAGVMSLQGGAAVFGAEEAVEVNNSFESSIDEKLDGTNLPFDEEVETENEDEIIEVVGTV